jgi:hypothetical protein
MGGHDSPDAFEAGRGGAAAGSGGTGAAPALQQASLKSHFRVVKHASSGAAHAKAALPQPLPAASSWDNGGSAATAVLGRGSSWAAARPLHGVHAPAQPRDGAVDDLVSMGRLTGGAADSTGAGYASDDSDCCPSICMPMPAPAPKRMRGAAVWAATSAGGAASSGASGAASARGGPAWRMAPVSGARPMRRAGSMASASVLDDGSCQTAAAHDAPAPSLLAPSASAGALEGGGDAGYDDEAETMGPMGAPRPAGEHHRPLSLAPAPTPAAEPARSHAAAGASMRPGSAAVARTASAGASKVTRAGASGGASSFQSQLWALPQAAPAAARPGSAHHGSGRRARAPARPHSAARSAAAAPVLSLLLARGGGASQQVSSIAPADDEWSDDALSCMRRADEGAGAAGLQQWAPAAPPACRDPSAAARPPLLDDPLEGVPWAGPPQERPDYYQSRYEQALYGLNYAPPPPRAAGEEEE